MKELIHVYEQEDQAVNEEIQKFIKNNPDVAYSKVNSDSDVELFRYYTMKFPVIEYPLFLGYVNGDLQDGHIGFGTEMVLSSLVN